MKLTEVQLLSPAQMEGDQLQYLRAADGWQLAWDGRWIKAQAPSNQVYLIPSAAAIIKPDFYAEPEKKRFECPDCTPIDGRTFVSKHALTLHRTRVHGELKGTGWTAAPGVPAQKEQKEQKK